jgi:hypothetical protein
MHGIVEIAKLYVLRRNGTQQGVLEVMEELVKAYAPLFKISSGFAEILYLLILLEVLALLVLQLLFKEGVCG